MPFVCEIKVLTLREVGPRPLCDIPPKAVEFFRAHVETAPWFDSEKECAVVIMLNARRHVTSFQLIATGTIDTCFVPPRDVFRAAIVSSAAAVILMHNHPSGDPSPSDPDVIMSRGLITLGNLLNVELLDSIIVGQTWADPKGKGYCSLRELGYLPDAFESAPTPPRQRRRTRPRKARSRPHLRP